MSMAQRMKAKPLGIVPDGWSATLKAVTTRKALLAGINLPAKAAARTSSISALRCLQLEGGAEGLLLTGTNLAVDAHSRIAGSGSGKACVRAGFLRELVAVLPDGEVQFAPVGAKVEVRAGGMRFTLPDHDAASITLPIAEGTRRRIAGADLAKGLRAVVAAASADDTRPILGGVHLVWGADGIHLAATDTYRLNRYSIATAPGEAEWIIPAHAIRLLLQGLDAATEWEISEGEGYLRFADGKAAVGFRLTEGKFPPVTRVIPTEKSLKHRWVFEVLGLARALRALELVAREAPTKGRITFTGDTEGVALTARSDDHEAALRIAATTEGGAFQSDFSAAYLQGAVAGFAALGADRVAFRFAGPEQPCLIEDASSSPLQALVMPIRSE